MVIDDDFAFLKGCRKLGEALTPMTIFRECSSGLIRGGRRWVGGSAWQDAGCATSARGPEAGPSEDQPAVPR